MFKTALLAAFAVALAVPATAQVSDDDAHVVTVNVAAVRAITVGPDLALTLTAPAPGDATLVYTGASTYGVLTNSIADIVTASVAGFPALGGLTLAGTYEAPGLAVGGTDVALTETETNVVTGVTQVSADGLSIDYEAEADVDLLPGQYDLTVTYTIKAAI